MPNENYPHIFLVQPPHTIQYTSHSARGRTRLPQRDQRSHGERLRLKFDEEWQQAGQDAAAVSVADRNGVYIEFKSEPGFDLTFESLEGSAQGVRLMSVREEGETEEEVTTFANVFIPDGQQRVFLNKLEQYNSDEPEEGKNRRNQKLIDSISDIKSAAVKSFWTDTIDSFPAEEENVWLEIWLNKNEEGLLERFGQVVNSINAEISSELLSFPERTVVCIRANLEQLRSLIASSPDIAEIRRAKELAHVLFDFTNTEQAEWVEDVRRRLQIVDSGVSVCILDSGVNNGHTLLEPLLHDDDCHCYDDTWGSHDHKGHGTQMAGLTAFGDLQQAIESSDPIEIRHRLESVKILPPGSEVNPPKLYGHITARSISLAKMQAPERNRIICMAVATTDFRDRGKPSSWSAEVDNISSGVHTGNPQLIIVAAGNVDVPGDWLRYPESNQTNHIHDPGQSWNALTVGAYTELDRLEEEGYAGWTALAPLGGLSPFSTTSVTWQKPWPLKPDFVMEGGNVAISPDGTECSEATDLSLLTVHHDTTRKQFDMMNATSAATAQAAELAAKIQSFYPDAWPETIRALMVHSCDWTPEMRSRFLPDETRGSYENLLRTCGYGVPNLEKAIQCASNSLTLIAEHTLQPFDRVAGRGDITKDMHFYELPWPREELLALEETNVAMRITLSYFIEPGPGRIGWKNKYQYSSYGLRFDQNTQNETQTRFVSRMNAAVEAEDDVSSGTGSHRWKVGKTNRSRGSIHSDMWEGTAAELAACNLIAVHPVNGWWRKRTNQNCWNKEARYSLIITLSTPETEVDLYTPIATAVQAMVPIEIPV